MEYLLTRESNNGHLTDAARRLRKRRRVSGCMRRRRAALRSRIPALAVMIGLAAGLTGFALAGGANGFDNALTYQADASEKPVYEAVVVRSGDTIWGLAEAYGDDSRSIRSLVNEICAVNDVAAGDLYPGQVMRIPVASGNYS